MSRRHRRINGAYLSLCTLIVLGVFGYVLIPLAWQRSATDSLSPATGSAIDILAMRDRCMLVLAVAFLFWLGGCIGSFMNVVIYRIPRNRTLMGNSMCPYCGVRIRARDNVPVFSWIKLRGRCRVCRLPIAPRYFRVELLMALLFLLMGVVELGSMGGNLPGHDRVRHDDFATAILLPDWKIAVVYAAHMLLISGLVTAAMIRGDGFRTSTQFWCYILVPLAIACGVTQEMHPVAWWTMEASTQACTPWQRLQTSILGLLMGGCFGYAVNAFGKLRGGSGLDACAGAATGLALGWQATIGIAGLAMFIRFLVPQAWTERDRMRALSLAACWTASCVTTLVFWKSIHETWGQPLWEAILFLP